MTQFPQGYLQCVEGADRGRVVSVDLQPFSIGSSDDNALVIRGRAVPDHLALLVYTHEGGWRIQAVGSGVRVAGEEVKERRLRDGDAILLGPSTWRFLSALPVSPPKEKMSGSRKRAVVAVAVVLIVAGASAGLWTARRWQSPLPASLDASQIKAQGMKAMKEKEWGRALEALGSIPAGPAPDPEIQALAAQAESELKHSRTWEEARLLRGKERYQDALNLLDQIPAASAYAPEAKRLREEIQNEMAEKSWAEAQARFRNKEWGEARRAARSVLKGAPGHAGASRLLGEIDRQEKKARGGGKRAVGPPKGPEQPSWIEPYLSGEWEKARGLLAKEREEARDDLKTLRAKEVFDRLAAVEEALREGTRQMENRRIPEAAGAWEKAAALEKSLGLDKTSRPVAEMGKRLAQEYARMGQEAFGQKAFAAAYGHWARALRQDAGMEEARQGLARLRKIAAELFEEAYRLEASDRKAALRKYEEVLTLVSPEDDLHQKAAARLQGGAE